jgi:Tfp pilus assembly protein PilF
VNAVSSKTLLAALFLLTPVCAKSAGQTPPPKDDEIALHAGLADKYLQEKRPDLAIPELEKVVALDPGNIDAHGNLGVLLFFRGDYKAAVPQLSTAVKSKPDLWKLQALLGLGEARLGDSSASRADLEAAFPHLESEKIQEDVGRQLIDEYTADEELEKASGVVSTLLATRPTDASLLYLSYRLYSDLAGRSMLTLALVAPDSAEMHQVMARELARQGDNANAIANYREAIKLNPKLPGLHTELGDLLFHSDDTNLKSQAEAELRAGLAANPKDEQAELMLGMIAEKRGDNNAAYEDYSRAMALNPNDGDACTELAKLLVTMNQPQKAMEMFEKATEIDPTNDVAHYRLATLYRQAGKTDEAKQQVALYLKYKKMKDGMDKIFHDMRVLSGHPRSDDENAKQ